MRADRLFAPFRFQRSRGALSVYDFKIKDVVTDPHKATAEAVYVCVRTPLLDGHKGAALAYANGCRCFVAARGLGLPADAAVYTTEDPEAHLGALAARCFGYPARSMTVIGITGTHGKTSVAYTLASLLTHAGRSVALLTSDGVDVGGVFTKAGAIAPNAADIQRMLRAARRQHAELAIVEFSSYMLAHKAEKSIPFAAVLLTDLAPRHISAGGYSDLATCRAATERLLQCGAPLVLLPDDQSDLAAKGNVIRYGEAGDISWHQAQLIHTKKRLGMAFTLTYQGESTRVFYPVVGDFALHNATAAVALALAVGLSLAEAAAGLATAVPAGRLECILTLGGAHVFTDTAYEAEELAHALRVLRTVTEGKLSVLLGSVGGRAHARRAPLGRAAVENADVAYFTADDPDGELPDAITRDMVAEFEDLPRYHRISSRREAIFRAVADLRRGDTLLILGKARDHTQLVMGAEQKFCDRDTVLEAVRQS